MTHVLWQRCPVCNGTGFVSRPPGVAGDQTAFSSSGGTRMVISTPDTALGWPTPGLDIALEEKEPAP